MALFLNRIDTSALVNIDTFNYQFLQWLWVLIDVLNEDINSIQNAIVFFTATGFTQAEIIALDSAGDLSDGVILYDNTNHEYVGRQNGVLVKFTTAVYP